MAESDNAKPVGRVPSRGVGLPSPGGMVSQRCGDYVVPTKAGLGNPAYNGAEPPPRRLRRLHRVWADRDGNVSYLLTLCVDGRARVLDNEETFQRLTAFLLDSAAGYGWFPRRFVVMPDHIHLIAHMGGEAVRLGQWIKALKAVVGGLERRGDGLAPRPVGAPGLQNDVAVQRPIGGTGRQGVVGRVPLPGSGDAHKFTRLNRSWRWQAGFHDHKFRTPDSEQRKWEYVCLNPARYGLVERPEQWRYGGEIFYEEAGGPALVAGTPPLLETGLLVNEDGKPPAEGSRSTTCPGAPTGGSRPTV